MEVILNDGLQKVGNGAFQLCSSLESITLPCTVTEIGKNAFNLCSNLREVVFHDGLQKIEHGVFQYCTSIESITLPSTVTEIGGSAFDRCNNLEEVTFNDGLRKIGNAAFYKCTSLKNVSLPSTLVEIGSKAFKYCNNLREVELNGVPQSVMSDAFDDCDELERFLFPTISYRRDNIIQTNHWEDCEDKLNQIRGVLQWENNKLFVSRPTHQNWDYIRRDFGRIAQLVSYYELKEATSTFELALWKSKLDQVDATNITNRAAYRIDVPGPVKDTMLQYLDQI